MLLCLARPDFLGGGGSLVHVVESGSERENEARSSVGGEGKVGREYVVRHTGSQVD